MQEIKCCNCGTRRLLTEEETLVMKNLRCSKCSAKLKVVGMRFDLSGPYYATEPEDPSLDF